MAIKQKQSLALIFLEKKTGKKQRRCVWSKRWFVVISLIAPSGSAVLLIFDLTVVVGSHTTGLCIKSSDSVRISSGVKFDRNGH